MVVLAVAFAGGVAAFTVTAVAPDMQVLSVVLLTNIECEPAAISENVTEV